MIYYNENDPKAAAWLRELIARNLIAPGEVDERSIEDLTPNELRPFRQCHFFAGIGGWSLALRLAGWPDDRPVWTGSCPCQPFSAAGKGAGFADERHLWPSWFWLIEQCRPRMVFGEQVASAGAWLDLVCTDLEGLGYACAPIVIPACSVGAPHIRSRLWWVADTQEHGWRDIGEAGNLERAPETQGGRGDQSSLSSFDRGAVGGLADSEGVDGWNVAENRRYGIGRKGGDVLSESSDVGGLAVASSSGREGHRAPVRPARQEQAEAVERGASFWSAADWIPCADGKARPVEPGTFPLAHGIPARVVRLRGYGNAINPHTAAEVIRAVM